MYIIEESERDEVLYIVWKWEATDVHNDPKLVLPYVLYCIYFALWYSRARVYAYNNSLVCFYIHIWFVLKISQFPLALYWSIKYFMFMSFVAYCVLSLQSQYCMYFAPRARLDKIARMLFILVLFRVEKISKEILKNVSSFVTCFQFKFYQLPQIYSVFIGYYEKKR